MLAAEALGDVRLALGEFESARAAFMIARRRVRGDAVERARLLRKEGIVAYRLGAYPRALRILTGALALLEGISSAPATAQRARIEALLGMITLWHGRPRESVAWLAQATADAEVGRLQGGAGPRARRPRPGLQRARRFAARGPQREGARDLQRARRPRQPGRRAQQPRLDRVLRRPLERGARPLPSGGRGLGSGRRHAQRLDSQLQHRRDPLRPGQARGGRAAAARGRESKPRRRRRVRHRRVDDGDGAAGRPARQRRAGDHATRGGPAPARGERQPHSDAARGRAPGRGARSWAASTTALRSSPPARSSMRPTTRAARSSVPCSTACSARHICWRAGSRPPARRSSSRSPRPTASSTATRKRSRSQPSAGTGRASSEASARRDALFEQLGIVALPAGWGRADSARREARSRASLPARAQLSQPQTSGRSRPCRRS